MDQRLVGDWDVHHGPVYSILLLNSNGAYQHALWDNSFAHWGRWSSDLLTGQLVMKLELAGASPSLHMTPFGPQPVHWPLEEVWVITRLGPDLVTFGDGLMARQAPHPMMPQQLSQSLTPTAPIIKQWQSSQTDWAAVRKVYQDLYAADQNTTKSIANAQQEQFDKEIKARQDAMTATSGGIHAGVPHFLNALKGIQSH